MSRIKEQFHEDINNINYDVYLFEEPLIENNDYPTVEELAEYDQLLNKETNG